MMECTPESGKWPLPVYVLSCLWSLLVLACPKYTVTVNRKEIGPGWDGMQNHAMNNLEPFLMCGCVPIPYKTS
jgi:hypothetical protein